MTTLLIADDDNLVRSALTSQLGGEFEVVAAAADAEQAVAAAVEHQPDVALIDVQMPGGGGVHATRKITERCPGTAVVALSADESHEVVLEMLNAGAMAYVLKSASRSEIVGKIAQSVEAFSRLNSQQQS
jgi:DNA-binding NarL/FixJ family response regulator